MEAQFIKFQEITKLFPGQRALDNVSFSICKGEIHALVGENGAGKSTLLNILHGILQKTSGEIYIAGKRSEFADAYEAINAGVIKVHQEIILVPEMTVMDNLLLGFEPTHSLFLNKNKMFKETTTLLKSLKCQFSPYERVKNLNISEKQMLQIAKALRLKAKIISFDEPTSSLTNIEVSTLFNVIRKLKEQGITIIYITHKLEEIYKICDRATVLRDGEYIGTYELKDLTIEALINKMVGREIVRFAKRQKPPKADWNDVVLKANHLSGKLGFQDVNFELHRGEILGFYGLVGAKRTETLMSLFGSYPLTSGTIEINGKPALIKSPADATKFGLGLVPENRKEQGFVKDLNNCDNISLASLDRFSKKVFQNKQAKIKNSVAIGQKVGITPNDPDFPTVNMSGGNQQKVIVAKWLSTNSNILILDEPTKGIDVGAKSDIYSLIEGLLDEGKSIIMISGELPEIMGMSDRIIVMHDGEIAASLSREEFDEAAILTYAVGGKVEHQKNN